MATKRKQTSKVERYLPEAPAEHPIYSRGYFVGRTRPTKANPESSRNGKQTQSQYRSLTPAPSDHPGFGRGYYIGSTAATKPAAGAKEPSKKGVDMMAPENFAILLEIMERMHDHK